MKRFITVTPRKIVVTKDDGSSYTCPLNKGIMQIIELLAMADEHIFCSYLFLEEGNMVLDYLAENPVYKLRDIAELYQRIGSYSHHTKIDPEYLKDIRKGLNRLNYELAIAKEYNDLGMIEAKSQEIKEIVKVLKDCYDSKKKKYYLFPEECTKMMKAVRKAIKRGLDYIEKRDPEFGRFLRKNLDLNYYCRFRSDPEVFITIEFRANPDNYKKECGDTLEQV